MYRGAAERERLRGLVLHGVGGYGVDGYDVVVTTYEMLKSVAMRAVRQGGRRPLRGQKASKGVGGL